MRRFFSVILCEQVIFFFIKKGPVFWLLGNNRSHSGPNFMTGPSFVSRLRAIVCYIDQLPLATGGVPCTADLRVTALKFYLTSLQHIRPPVQLLAYTGVSIHKSQYTLRTSQCVYVYSIYPLIREQAYIRTTDKRKVTLITLSLYTQYCPQRYLNAYSQVYAYIYVVIHSL